MVISMVISMVVSTGIVHVGWPMGTANMQLKGLGAEMSGILGLQAQNFRIAVNFRGVQFLQIGDLLTFERNRSYYDKHNMNMLISRA